MKAKLTPTEEMNIKVEMEDETKVMSSRSTQIEDGAMSIYYYCLMKISLSGFHFVFQLDKLNFM